MQPTGPKKPVKRKPVDALGVQLKRANRQFWLGTALAFLAIAAGALLIIYAPAGDPKLIAFGLFIAVCGALTWGVLKIIAYFKVAVIFMLRQAEKHEKPESK